ncbi:MAG: hypothetical protein DRP50_03095 [Thermotoga sp.]|nr:MAG: hypothetical protein DRP50_03095 [Thermotoga sp.]
MSKLREDIVVIGCAVPKIMANSLEKIRIEEGYQNKSDMLRAILFDYLKGQFITAFELHEISKEIEKMEANRR